MSRINGPFLVKPVNDKFNGQVYTKPSEARRKSSRGLIKPSTIVQKDQKQLKGQTKLARNEKFLIFFEKFA